MSNFFNFNKLLYNELKMSIRFYFVFEYNNCIHFSIKLNFVNHLFKLLIFKFKSNSFFKRKKNDYDIVMFNFRSIVIDHFNFI